MRRVGLTVLCAWIINLSCAQTILDPCFQSAEPNWTFESSEYLVNVTSEYILFVESADLLQWERFFWDGEFPNANVSVDPPRRKWKCRAIWMGHGSEWTDGGEGFAVKFEPPLEAGEYYEFPITYVSDGMYSDSSFDPAIYTNSIASLENADSLGRLPPAGTEWLKTDFGFVADSSQDGHEWLIIHTGTIVSSGLISSFCPDCIPCEDYDFHLGSDTIVCVEDNFRLTIDSIPDNSSVLWNTGSTNPFLEIIETDRYFVEVITEECAADDTLYVEVISKPNFDLGIDRELCPGDKIELSAHSIYSEYIWNTGTSDSLDIITEPGWYSATAINQCGIYSDSVRFVCEKIIMPNVFSPNADGINDNFAPLVYEDINDANLRIFNRWGKEVFNTDRIENGWNGNINGKTASTGAYYWHLSYINIYGDVVQINGQFQLKE